MSGKIRDEYLNPNKSKTYLLPLFARELSLKYLDQIENTFLFTEGVEIIPSFAILYKYTDKVEYTLEGNEGFMYYSDLLKESEYYLTGFELGDYSLFVFKLPDSLNYAYGCLVEGKYSWLLPDDKKTIISYLTKHYPREKSIITEIIGILNKSPVLRQKYEKYLSVSIDEEIELSSKIDQKKETIDPEHALGEE